MKRILVTGASGYIASQLLPALRGKYELTLTDVANSDREGERVQDVEVIDLMGDDRSKFTHLFEGQDSVIHLAYRRSSSGGVYGDAVPHIERFDTELSNVKMANNVYRCAYEAGVKRVVMASSNHAADWYEHALIHRGKKETVFPDELPLSDNFYGWAKAAYELLGYPYACGAFGRKLEVVQVRIGNPRNPVAKDMLKADFPGHGGSGIASYKRALGAHFSERDLQQLFVRAVETKDISNQNGVPWLVVYGISGNTRAFWSIQSARDVLEYEPQDDSEVKFADDIRTYVLADPTSGPGRVGSLHAGWRSRPASR